MAVESKSNINWSESDFNLEIEGIKNKKQEIPYDRILKFSYEFFKQSRIPLIKARIETLVERMLTHPDKKPAYIQEINKLILFEMDFKKKRL